MSKILHYRVQSYPEVALWKQKALPYIKDEEGWNNLFWQIIKNREKSDAKKWAGSVFCKGKISLSALHTPSNFLLLSHGNVGAVEALAKYANREEWILNGVSGPEHLVNHFIQSSKQKIGSHMDLSKRIFRIFQTCLNGEEIVNEDYHLGLVREIDWPKARIWAQQFAMEADYPMELTAIVQMAKQMNLAKNLFMLTDSKNHPCAMAGLGRSTDRYRVINMVYVPKDLRGQGIGRELIIQLSRYARELGYEQCLLFSEWIGHRNLYEVMGCKSIGKFMECQLA